MTGSLSLPPKVEAHYVKTLFGVDKVDLARTYRNWYSALMVKPSLIAVIPDAIRNKDQHFVFKTMNLLPNYCFITVTECNSNLFPNIERCKCFGNTYDKVTKQVIKENIQGFELPDGQNGGYFKGNFAQLKNAPKNIPSIELKCDSQSWLEIYDLLIKFTDLKYLCLTGKIKPGDKQPTGNVRLKLTSFLCFAELSLGYINDFPLDWDYLEQFGNDPALVKANLTMPNLTSLYLYDSLEFNTTILANVPIIHLPQLKEVIVSKRLAYPNFMQTNLEDIRTIIHAGTNVKKIELRIGDNEEAKDLILEEYRVLDLL